MGTIGKFFKKSNGGKTFASNYFIGEKVTKETIKKFEKETRFNELIHSPLTFWSGYRMIEAISNEDYTSAIINGIAMLINGYCTMLQRYHRAKIYNILEKKERLNKK